MVTNYIPMLNDKYSWIDRTLSERWIDSFHQDAHLVLFRVFNNHFRIQNTMDDTGGLGDKHPNRYRNGKKRVCD
jgi:hypothetical protein